MEMFVGRDTCCCESYFMEKLNPRVFGRFVIEIFLLMVLVTGYWLHSYGFVRWK